MKKLIMLIMLILPINICAYENNAENRLKTFEIKDLDFDFDPNIDNYNISVSNDIATIEYQYTLYDENCTVESNNITNLSIGLNDLTIRVYGMDGSLRAYHFIINRLGGTLNATNNLSQLKEYISSNVSSTINVKLDLKEEIVVLPTSFVSELKNSQKEIVFERKENNEIITQIILKGQKITNINPINLNFTNNITDPILINYLKKRVYTVINTYNSNIPEIKYKTKMTSLKDYYLITTENNNIIKEEIKLNENYVELTLLADKEYAIVEGNIEISNMNNDDYSLIIIVSSMILLMIISFIVIKINKVKNKDKKSIEQE